LLAGDRWARDRFAVTAGPRLQAILRRDWAGLPPELLADAATDAILFVLEHPDRYRPTNGSLMNFLVHIARRRLQDALRRQERAKKILDAYHVELRLVSANQSRQTDPAASVTASDPDTLPPEIERWLAELFPDPRDRRLWELICQEGRSSTRAFAGILGVTHLPLDTQQRLVKQHRDRILKKVQRRREEFRRRFQ
jgi:RNA polymerase sigma factor (sigma-70 family)